MRQERIPAHSLGITGGGTTKCPKPPDEAVEIAQNIKAAGTANRLINNTRPTHQHIMYVYYCCRPEREKKK